MSTPPATLSDTEFWTEFETLLPKLKGAAFKFQRSTAGADDLVQETFLKAWQARHRFTPGTNMRAWAHTILRNAFLTQIRRRKFECEASDLDVDALWCQERQTGHMVLKEVRRALESMSPSRRQVLALIGEEGYSYEEAAAACDCCVGTIKSRLSRARKDLEAKLEALPDAEVPIRRE